MYEAGLFVMRNNGGTIPALVVISMLVFFGVGALALVLHPFLARKPKVKPEEPEHFT